jgi:hypothetical protein
LIAAHLGQPITNCCYCLVLLIDPLIDRLMLPGLIIHRGEAKTYTGKLPYRQQHGARKYDNQSRERTCDLVPPTLIAFTEGGRQKELYASRDNFEKLHLSCSPLDRSEDR